MARTDRERPKRRWIAVLALFAVAGLELAALPPELVAGSGECVMACSLEGRECCCQGFAGAAMEHHGGEAPADGRLSVARPRCREQCAAVACKAPGGDLSLFAGDRQAPSRPERKDRVAPSPADFRSLEHGDPSTLPRPPPPAASC